MHLCHNILYLQTSNSISSWIIGIFIIYVCTKSHLPWCKQLTIMTEFYVFIFNTPLQITYMRHVMFRLAWTCCIFRNCLVKGMIFREMYFTWNMFLIHQQILLTKFHNLERIQHNFVIDIWRSLNSVWYFCLILTKPESSRPILIEVSNIRFHEIPSNGS